MPVPRTCAAAHCDGKEHIFSWPGDEKIARKWTAFVSVKVANFKPKSTSRLCFRHFQPSDFHNWSQYTMMTDHPIRLVPNMTLYTYCILLCTWSTRILFDK